MNGTMDLVTVFRGPYPRALALQATLGALGWMTHLRDGVIMVIDPTIRGDQIFDVSLEAMEEQGPEIGVALRELAAPVDGDEIDGAPEETSRAAESLGLYIRWCVAASLFALPAACVVAPLVFYLAPRYLRAARRERPVSHRWTCIAFVLAAVEAMALLAWLAAILVETVG